jgi:hypothetical protein
MSRYKLLAGAAASALASGCGGSGSPAATSSTASAQKVAALHHELGQCIRSHGDPSLPDPVLNQQTGTWGLAPGAVAPQQGVLNACQSIIAQIPSQGLPASRAFQLGIPMAATCGS